LDKLIRKKNQQKTNKNFQDEVNEQIKDLNDYIENGGNRPMLMKGGFVN
jgi:hypothetical protein